MTTKSLTEGGVLELPVQLQAAEDLRTYQNVARKAASDERVTRAFASFVYLPPRPLVPREIPKKLEACSLEELYALHDNPETVKKYKAPVEWSDKKFRICTTCHHFKHAPPNFSHRCPVDAEGNIIACKCWSTCPVPWRRDFHSDQVDINPKTKNRIQERIKELAEQSAERDQENRKGVCYPASYEIQTLLKSAYKTANQNNLDPLIADVRALIYAREKKISPEEAKRQLALGATLSSLKEGQGGVPIKKVKMNPVRTKTEPPSSPVSTTTSVISPSPSPSPSLSPSPWLPLPSSPSPSPLPPSPSSFFSASTVLLPSPVLPAATKTNIARSLLTQKARELKKELAAALDVSFEQEFLRIEASFSQALRSPLKRSASDAFCTIDEAQKWRFK